MVGTEGKLKLTINGTDHEINGHDIDVEMPLNTFLRRHLNLKGTKVMCREGGCGACTVSVCKKDAEGMQNIAVNSCLVPLHACHGWSISTVDGIGGRSSGYHPVQKRLAAFHGTQCGFCSPGMVMNMHALTTQKGPLAMADVEDSFGGNLCRCTGYRPILDAFKSLCSDAPPELAEKNCSTMADIEELKLCKNGTACKNGTGPDCKNACKKAALEKLGENCYKANKLAAVFDIFEAFPTKSIRLTAGNTAKGVYKKTKNYDIVIDITSVPELTTFTYDSHLRLGGNMSLTETMAALRIVNEKNPHNFWYFDQIISHLCVVANVQVRNIGTIAGNLMMKHEHNEFPSDVFVLLTAVGARLLISRGKEGNDLVSMEQFLSSDMQGKVIVEIELPPLAQESYIFHSFKITPRAQNAHAYLNAAFLIGINDKNTVQSSNIVYGGINPKFVHAERTERFLLNKNVFDNATLQGAFDALAEEIHPDNVITDASPEYRKNLAISLFYKFILLKAQPGLLPEKLRSAALTVSRPLSNGVQTFTTDKSKFPLGEPVPKLDGLYQCSGEAEYVDDMPSLPDELFAVYVTAKAKPLSTIAAIDASKALAIEGVAAFIDHKTVRGSNTSIPRESFGVTEEEELFCSGKVRFHGQPVGVIVAKTFEQAHAAADLVQITYNESNEKPYFNTAEVLADRAKDRIVGEVSLQRTEKGNDTKHVIRGTFNIGEQYHFAMETQCAICIPKEDGFDLYASTQWLDLAQLAAAKALNISQNKIQVFVKRLGGAYGSKISRNSMVSTACAVAAQHLNKPVRMALTMQENMQIVGKRFPCYAEYEVGVDEDGRIQYLDNTYYENTGCYTNENIVAYAMTHVENCYEKDRWTMTGSLVRTDTPVNTWCRAPASTEGIGMTEAIMEHVAMELGKDPLDVKRLNFAKDNDAIRTLVEELLNTSHYHARRQEIEDFNQKNRWIKKGISIVPMTYHLPLLGPFGVIVSIYHADGSVALSHGGVESGQGINTKVAQVCAHVLGIPLDMVSVVATNTLNTPNNFTTAGSITSEACSLATIKACKAILERMKPIRDTMKNNPSWAELVAKCHEENIILCETASFTVNDVQRYVVNGACVSEVELDILTGQYQLKRVDILEETGQSLSPQIDVGQVEGAFVMGLGYYMMEDVVHDPDTGAVLTDRTWNYKIPGAKDIPIDFRIEFKKNSFNPAGVLNSKATGEPPLCLSISVPLAVRHALASARRDADEKPLWVALDGPTTTESTFMSSVARSKYFTL